MTSTATKIVAASVVAVVAVAWALTFGPTTLHLTSVMIHWLWETYLGRWILAGLILTTFVIAPLCVADDN
jgi:hypothetical protein